MIVLEPPAQTRRTARVAAIAVGLVVLLLVAVLATRKSSQSSVPDNPLIGRPAPSIDAANAAGGGRVTLAGLRGRFVLVNFFNEWCVPCVAEHPELLKFSERHKVAGDAQLVAVNHGGDLGAEREFLAKNGGDWPVVDDPRGAIALDYGVRGQPETFVIDPQGVVVTRIAGPTTADGLDGLLRQVRAAEA